MRCDANISIRLKGASTLGTRVEVKNLNSIRNVKRAIDLEVERLIGIVENGDVIQQETRSYNADNNTSFSLRSKEDADDYRYFPDPDLTPFHITDEFLESIKAAQPALPNEVEKKYIEVFHLPAYDAAVICSDRSLVNYYEAIVGHTANHKAAANWLMGPIKSYLNDHGIDIAEFSVTPKKIAELINLVDEGKVSFSIASTKILSAVMVSPATSPVQLAADMNLVQETNNDALTNWVSEVIGKMPDKVKEYRAGKKGLIGLFAGEVKKLSKGKADMQAVNKLLAEKLN
jgi:aspartyl-tRNA(Asn)/glutamyl-tRNA(Gln) amidotransferase subunit B